MILLGHAERRVGIATMSLYEHEVSTLTLGPRIRGSDERLAVRSSWLLEALTLFSWKRLVEVEAAARVVRITSSTLWRPKPPREIPFSEVKAVWRTAKRLNTGLTITGESKDRIERFLVALELKGGERIPLFTFSGEGGMRTGIGGVILGDSVVDMHGAQDRLSAVFARRLAAILGAELMDAPF